MPKKTPDLAILEQLSSEKRRAVSASSALILLHRATLNILSDERSWPSWATWDQWFKAVSSLLNRMVKRGQLVLLDRIDNVYKVAPPYASEDELTKCEILTAANPFAAISHLSALIHHRLTDVRTRQQTVIVPPLRAFFLTDPSATDPSIKEQATIISSVYDGNPFLDNPAPSEVQDISFVAVGLEPKAILEWRMQWIHVRPERYFGFQEQMVDNCLVRVTTLERTLIDCLQEPIWGGGIENVLRAWALSRNSINLDALIDVVNRFDIGVLRQRVGFILDELELVHPSVEAWRSLYAQRGGSSKLLASAPYAPTYSERWSLSINAPTTALKG